MPIELYPSIAKIKRNGVYENLPGFVPEIGAVATQQMIATSESTATAQYVHNKGEYFRLNDTLYQAIVKINVGDAIVVGTNCEVAVIGNDLTHVANSIANYELGIATSSHNTGDYFMVGETMYLATADIQVGDNISTSTNCRKAVVGDELSALQTALNDSYSDTLTNIASSFTYTNGKGIRILSNGDIRTLANCSYTDYVAVTPNQVILINQDIGSSSYGHGFYNSSKQYVSGIISNSDSHVFTVPDNVYYIRFTVLTTGISTLVVNVLDGFSNFIRNELPNEIKESANPFQTYTIKSENGTIDGFTHCAFPTAALFAGKELIAFRAGMSHVTPSDPTKWGGIMIWTRSPDGTWENLGVVDLTELGINGEFRDPKLTVSRDGQTLFVSGFTCYRTEEAPTTDIYDTVILTLNTSFEVTGAFVETNANYLFWGNVLETPEGHLLVASYYDNVVKVHRSTAAYNGTISSITFDTPITIDESGQEPTIGYWNDKIVLIHRRNKNSSHVTFTENLEGNSGWQTCQIPTGGYIIHAPVLLPCWKGEYLPFAGARYNTDNDRYPMIGLLSFDDTNDTFAYVFGVKAANITRYSGYCGLVYFGGCDFGMAYYLESAQGLSTLNASTGLYYKHFNLRTLAPQMAYLQDPNTV